MSQFRAFDRRRFLQGAAVAAAATPTLAACGGGGTDNSAGNNSKVKLPTHVPYRGVRPDLPGNSSGVMDGFLRYPAAPVKASTKKPGNGGTVSAMVQTYSPIPPPASRNQYWKELNNRLGVDLKMSLTDANSYADKFQTTIAGGDLPDFIQVIAQPPQLPALLHKECQDLTEYLSGDAVKEYPFLANIPTYSWRAAVYNGGIYGVPLARGVAGIYIYRRDDLIAAKSLDPNPGSFAEFHKLCVELTEPRKNIWALSTPPISFIQQMLKVPNGWRNDGGTLTSAFEVPETKQALGVTAKLVKDGLVHPDASGATVATLKQWFGAGKAILTWDSYPAWPGYYQANSAIKGFKIGAMPVPGFDGGQGTLWETGGVTSITALKKTSDKKRIKELLAIFDWLAIPFGTEEYLFRKYGVAGVDYQNVNGNPILTDKGKVETTVDAYYITDSLDVLFTPGLPDVTKQQYDFQKKTIPTAVQNPANLLYSPTQATKNAVVGKAINDAQADIIFGRKPLSSWDDAVKTWQRDGGNQMRKELQDALQKSS